MKSTPINFEEITTKAGIRFDAKKAKKHNDYCFACGTKADPEKCELVFFVEGGLTWAIPHAESDEWVGDPGFMGGQPIGPECAKRVRKVMGEEAERYIWK